MPILELSPDPAKTSNSPGSRNTTGVPPPPRPEDRENQPKAAATELAPRPTDTAVPKVRVGRFGDLEEHELIHLLDSLDDERSKARFRESIYISFIIYLAITWFLFYGPRVLFHQPEYKDLISAMKEHDKQVTLLDMPRTVAPRPPVHPMPDRKTMQKLQNEPRPTPPAPTETPTPTPPPPQQEQAHTTAPPVQQPQLPLPSAPRPTTALPDAPATRPTIASNSSSAHDSMQKLLRPSPGGADYGAPSPGTSGPLQAGATILSDTMGVDFTDYMRRLHRDIQRNWNPLIPEEVEPPLFKKGIVGIRFSILPDGTIGGMTLESKSGDVALDKAAWFAITSEGKFPPLPPQFHGPLLELRTGFFYNEEPIGR